MGPDIQEDIEEGNHPEGLESCPQASLEGQMFTDTKSQLLPPLAHIPIYVCVGVNYKAHLEEAGVGQRHLL